MGSLKEVERKIVGLAAKDPSGLLSPYTYTLRETGPEDVYLKVICCGICHTDIHQVKNDLGMSNYPMVPGHEVVGEVVEVGSAVTKFKPGNVVGVGCLVGCCRTCRPCKADIEQYCNKKIWSYNDVYTDGKPTQGGFAPSMVVDQKFVVKIPDEMAPEQAAPLLCAGVTVYSPLNHFGLKQSGLRGAILGLGGVGHARMQYHALSLARQASMDVDIIAYGGSEPHISVLEHQSIHIHKMPQWPTIPRGLAKILWPVFLILKPIFQFLMLLWYLCVKIPAPDAFIVQNPPSVPTLMVVKWASWWRKSAFIVDWHNFGYTLLALSLGRSSLFVALYHWIEKHYGKMAHGSLCVTRAMQHELSQNWGIEATVLYDQPPEFFRPASFEEKHKLFCRISKSLNKPYGLQDCISNGSTGKFDNDPPFTTQVGSDVFLKQNRPALIVSSTSWTPDEDFGILLEAALMYDRRVAALLGEEDSAGDEIIWGRIRDGKQYSYPRLLFIITGKGPEKEKYEQKIRKLRLRRVAFRTMWLSAEDYPLLLGSADLGVCLHTSSSGLDLPMKVVDMFGCGLPVCAVSYSCIKELIDVNKNGLLFSSSSELADELMMLFEGFPERSDALSSMRSTLMERLSSVRWATAWEENAKPLIHEVISRHSS